jgi:hypothetical protein|tara:strand:+ start:1554 stop:2111 length:558 start_codon:yes stop_codon:yes gene_type:complete
MSRDITSALNTEFNTNSIKPFYAILLDFATDPIRLWTGLGDISFGGESYVGGANILAIQTAKETGQIQANGATITLSGIPTDLISVALNINYQSRNAEIYFGALDANNAVIADPYIIFKGFMDTMSISDDGLTATIIINIENRLIRLENSKIRRFTSEDQKIDFPDDLGLDFIADLQDKELVWGR